jgi:glycine cleavage system H protein
MADVRFTKSHEWIAVEGGIGTVGITSYAAGQLGDVVFVDLPQPGKTFASGAEAAVVESVKAASEIYAPVAGEITETNGGLAGDPSVVNADPEGKGWFFRLKVANAAEPNALLTKDQYTELLRNS